MRKDGKNSYQALKQRLLDVRNELIEAKQDLIMNKNKQPLTNEHELNYLYHLYDKIWEIVTK